METKKRATLTKDKDRILGFEGQSEMVDTEDAGGNKQKWSCYRCESGEGC